MERLYTISAYTENHPGVLHRLTATLTRRKINIESLTVSETEHRGISRFTIVVRTTPSLISKIVKQIDRIIEVVHAFVSEDNDLIFREIGLIRVAADDKNKRPEIEELAHRHGAVVTYATDSSLIVEKTGEEDDINSLFLLLEPYGIREFIRSGRIALRKSSETRELGSPSGKGEDIGAATVDFQQR